MSVFFINPFAFASADGDFESIATVTVGSGGASSIEFTSIPGTYQHLQVRALARAGGSAGGNGGGIVRFNGDSGNNYTYHQLLGNGSAASAYGETGRSGAYFWTGSTTNAATIVDILDYASTSKNTTVRVLTGFDENGAGNIVMSSSLWLSTSAVTSIVLTGPTWQQHGTFALYGIKAP